MGSAHSMMQARSRVLSGRVQTHVGHNADIRFTCDAGVRDSSGFRLFVTSELRRYDMGIMELGLDYLPKNSIPPRAPHFHLSGFCTSECTQTVCCALVCNAPSLLYESVSFLITRPVNDYRFDDNLAISVLHCKSNYRI